MADPASWSVRRQTAPAVRLRPGANDALDPRDQIDVRQTQLPLGIALEVYDANGLSDAGAWRLVGTGGVAKMSDLTDVFPTRRYLRKPPKDQPFRGGLASGARFGSTAWSVPAGAVASDESLTEDRVLDSLMVPPPQPATGHPLNVGLDFAEAILIAAPTRAVERKWTRHAVALEAAVVNLFFLPFVRQGLTPAANAGARANVSVSFRLEAAGQPVARHLPHAGAGRAGRRAGHRAAAGAARVAGRRGARRRAGLLSADRVRRAGAAVGLQSDAAGGIAPRCPGSCSSCVEADPVGAPGTRRAGPEPVDPAPARRRARRELPDLGDAATWAHAQIACDTAAQIAATLAAHPDRTLSRLLAPRRLQPNRGYIAAVVPAYLSGRIAGLGEDPTGHPALVTGLEPAWSALDMPTRLPAYYAWTFRTGEAGDFESLAQRLHAVQLDPEGERTALHLSLPSGTGWVGRRLGSAAARDGAGGAAAAASRGRRQRDPHGAARRHEPADPRALVLRRAVDGRARGDADRGVGAGSEPDAGAARGGRPGRGRRAGRAGRAGRGRADAARRVHGGAARGTPAAVGHGVRQPGGAAAGGRAA